MFAPDLVGLGKAVGGEDGGTAAGFFEVDQRF